MFSEHISSILTFLKDHPMIGATSGVGSWFILSINFFTSPANLNFVGIIAAWCGLFIAVITMILKTIEAWDKITSKLKKKP